MTSNAKNHRRTLKEALRTILPRRRDDRESHLTTSPGLAGRDPSLALLPIISSLSILPNFDSSSFNIDQYSVSISDQPDTIPPRVWAADYSQQTIIPYAPSTTTLSQSEIADAYQYQSQLGQLARSCSREPDWYSGRPSRSLLLLQSETYSSRESLNSKTSSRQLVDPESIQFQSPLSQLAHACNVPSVYQYGASLQASLATLRSSNVSTSTLRLRRSTQDLPRVLDSPPVPKSKRVISIGRTVPAPEPEPIVVTPAQSEPHARDAIPVTPARGTRFAPPRQIQRETELDAGLSSIDHFSSFCVLDAASLGCPVTATSQDLRLVFDIGEDFCLDTVGIEGASMDTVTGQDAEGNAVVHLVIYSRLINPNSGRSRFVLASLLDITSFITGTASLPDLETISEESVVEEEISTPPRPLAHRSPRCGISMDSLFEQCSVEGQDPQTPLRTGKSDIWLDIASEETRRTRSMRSTPSTPRSCSSATTSSVGSMDDVLDQFLASLQVLYSDFFLLGKSPLDDNTYEICNVSTKVYDSREYIEGHLTRTSPSDRQYLERQLTLDKSFQMRVKWGVAGDARQLYCIPLFGRINITWVCFLVEEGKWGGLPAWN